MNFIDFFDTQDELVINTAKLLDSALNSYRKAELTKGEFTELSTDLLSDFELEMQSVADMVRNQVLVQAMKGFQLILAKAM